MDDRVYSGLLFVSRVKDLYLMAAGVSFSKCLKQCCCLLLVEGQNTTFLIGIQMSDDIGDHTMIHQTVKVTDVMRIGFCTFWYTEL